MKTFPHSPIVYSTDKAISQAIIYYFKRWENAKDSGYEKTFINKCYLDFVSACEEYNLSVLYVIEKMNL